ncbi:MAG: hypothetical protein IPN34_15240 [Planctomycetes bacterium]|nr:hypothetical protein [Planctomycetota bacterium]
MSNTRFAIISAVLLLTATSAAWIYNLALEHQKLIGEEGGVFGDRFGALTAAGSILGALLFAYALLLQIHEMKIMTAEFRESKEAAQITAAAQEAQVEATSESTKVAAASAIVNAADVIKNALNTSLEATLVKIRQAENNGDQKLLAELGESKKEQEERRNELPLVLGMAYSILRAEVVAFEQRRRAPESRGGDPAS